MRINNIPALVISSTPPGQQENQFENKSIWLGIKECLICLEENIFSVTNAFDISWEEHNLAFKRSKNKHIIFMCLFTKTQSEVLQG